MIQQPPVIRNQLKRWNPTSSWMCSLKLEDGMKWSGYRRKENGERAVVWRAKMKDTEGKMEFHKYG